MAKIILTGSCGDNATFNLYDDGLLEILGTGAMTNYSYYSDVPWYNASFTRATIANGITTVGELAFNGCTGLTSITIPDGVTSIGNYAFYDCTGLTSVTIPDSVTSIGGGAFSGCTSLTSITIPDSVTSIGNRAFYNCTGLTSITIPNSVTSIGQYAFRGCTSLTSVTIGNSVTSIGYSAFYNCTGLTSITLPDGVTSIGTYAFSGCTGLTSITIPDSVTSIGYSAFYNCTGLTSITIPNSVTSIGEWAFYDCTGLTSVTIPDSVTSIGGGAFSGCTSLTSITIPDSVTSIGSEAFYNCTGLTSITIPDSVTSIGYSAFYNCSGLTSVTLPSSIISIRYKTFKNCTSLEKITLKGQPPTLSDTEVFANTPIANGTGRINVPRRYLDDYTSDTNWIAFKAIIFGVETLAELFKKIANSIRGFSGKTDSIVAQNFPDEITNTVDGIKTACNEVIIDKGGTEAQTVQELPQAIKNLPLRYKLVYNGEDMSEDYTGNEEIQEVELVNVTTISGGFQEMPNLEKFTFADTYEEDDYSVLWECPKLKELSTGGCLSFDLSDAYSKNCPLEIINFGASMDSSSVFFDFWGLYNLQKLKALNVAEGNETMKSVDGVIYDVDIAQVLFFPPGYNKTYSIPDSVTDLNISNAFAWLFALPDFACSENNELYSVVDGVLFNKDQTELIRFPCGKNVNSYVIPDSVTSIGDYAFYGCTGLTSITIPDGVTSIGTYAFSGCTGLTSITIPDGVTSIGSFAFQNCTGLTSITIPDGVTSIGTYAFSGCTGLTSATLGTGVATINSYTFNSCTSLAKLTLNKADTYITLSATNALTNTPIVTSTTEGYVYVPSALLSSYQGATNWANYKNKIKATGSE